MLHIGHVATDDLVINKVGDVGQVLSVWQKIDDNSMFVEVGLFLCLKIDVHIRSSQRRSRTFFVAGDVVDVFFFSEEPLGIVRVAVPPALSYDEV